MGDKIDSAPTDNNPNKFDYATMIWNVLGNDFLKKQWTQRVAQAIGIDASDGFTYWLLPNDKKNRKAWVESFSAKYKVDNNEADWLKRFY